MKRDLNKEQYYKDRISYLEKELKNYKKQFKKISRIEKASIFIEPETFDKMNEIVSNLLVEKDADKLYEMIVKSIKQIFGFNRVGLMLIDEQKNELYHKFGFGLPESYTRNLRIPIKKQRGISMRASAVNAVLSRKPVIINDRSSDPDYNSRHSQTKKRYSHQFLMIPLKGKHKIWGNLTVATSRKESNFISESTVEILSFYANQVTLAIESFYYHQELENALSKMRLYSRELEKSNRYKEEFLNNISHELRTPLTPIIGYTDYLLSKKEITDQDREFLQLIYNSASKLFYLIEDLMDLTRISKGKYAFSFEVFDIRRLIRSVIDTVTPIAIKKNIKIKFKSPNFKAPVYLDFNRTTQILWNLLTNAVKFSDFGGTVTVKLRRRNDRFFVDVIDKGVGIDEKHKDIIFHQFKQLDGSITRKYGGVGIGLYLVRKFAELQNVKVNVYSKGKGRGTRFTLKIHKSKEYLKALKIKKPKISKIDKLKGKKVLIIEDDPVVIEMVNLLLGEMGAETKMLTTGVNVMRTYRNMLPDIILLDIALPGKNGFEILSDIRNNILDHKPKIIAITAYSSKENLSRIKSEDFNGFLLKPFSLAELYDKLT